jgi:hypothetical protein
VLCLQAGSEVEPLADVVLALSQMGWDDPQVQVSSQGRCFVCGTGLGWCLA